ncbi:hypothetical protein EPI10_025598 [Gossypium australe]|uniref:Uncharacterized protein n=1 Tax=Gossypium australe TaxID=47621 RepID=A0A5B6W2G9_9ROSI|nr:hypothetical protein EPI10_025598 [Gossypium australe]
MEILIDWILFCSFQGGKSHGVKSETFKWQAVIMKVEIRSYPLTKGRRRKEQRGGSCQLKPTRLSFNSLNSTITKIVVHKAGVRKTVHACQYRNQTI